MKKNLLELKFRLPEEGLYILLLKRIASCKKPNKELIKFPEIFSKVASGFSIPKKKVWALLFFLHDIGLITIVFGHGIKLNFSIKEVGI